MRESNKLKAKRVQSIASNGEVGFHSDGNKLYFEVTTTGHKRWVMRFKSPVTGSRREVTMAHYPEYSLAQARDMASEWRTMISRGLDPLLERQKSDLERLETVDSLWADFYGDLKKRIKTHKLDESLYNREVKPQIGNLPIKKVTAVLVRRVFTRCLEGPKPRPSVSTKVLRLLKRLFNHAVKLDLLDANPALSFSPQDAGGTDKARDRVLTLPEADVLFRAMRKAGTAISRENYLMVALLLVLGVRKMELGAAPWSEFDLEKGIWKLPNERAKKEHGLDIPLTPQVIEWLKELHTRAAGQLYVFPAKRASNSPHMCETTLNAALKIDHELEHFIVHDLRRSCRTLLSKLGVNSDHADRYTNHIPEGMRRIYDRHDFFEERRAAQEKLVEAIAPLL